MKIFIDEDKAQQQQCRITDITLHNFIERNLIDHFCTVDMSERYSNYIFHSLCPQLWHHFPVQHIQHYNQISAHEADLIIDIMMLHRVNDPWTIIQQTQKVLKKNGIFLTAFLGGATLSELRQSLIQTDLHFYKGAYQRFIPMIHPQSVCNLLVNCGLSNPIVDHKKIQFHYTNLRNLLRDLRNFGERGYLYSDQSNPTVNRAYYDYAENFYRQNFATPQNKLIATYDIIFAMGWNK